jgi:hypothetical protein
LANIRLHQYSHTTKVPPKMPMKDLRVWRPLAVRTRPVRATGMLKMQSREVTRIRGPSTSQRGPRKYRAAMVHPIPAMPEFQICWLVSCRVSAMYGRIGTTANHTKNDTK